MGVAYEVHHWDGLKWHDKHTMFHKDWFGHAGNIITFTMWEVVVLVLLMTRCLKYAADIISGGMIYIPSLIKTGSGVQKLLEGNTQTERMDGDCVRLL